MQIPDIHANNPYMYLHNTSVQRIFCCLRSHQSYPAITHKIQKLSLLCAGLSYLAQWRREYLYRQCEHSVALRWATSVLGKQQNVQQSLGLSGKIKEITVLTCLNVTLVKDLGLLIEKGNIKIILNMA